MKDVLVLHDTIASSARDIWNASEGSKAGLMKIFESKKRGKHEFPFIDGEGEYRLTKPALYIILGAFRRFVRRNNITNELEWITDFEKIKTFWEDNGRDMLVSIHETLSKDLGYSLTSLGKNGSLWTSLHSRVGIQIYEQGLNK